LRQHLRRSSASVAQVDAWLAQAEASRQLAHPPVGQKTGTLDKVARALVPWSRNAGGCMTSMA
jgi:predicted transcriptional regulator